MEEKIRQIKKKLSGIDTSDLLGRISINFVTFADDTNVAEESDLFQKTNLLSPQKQLLYLAGLLISTDNLCENNSRITETQFKGIKRDIQEITFEYVKKFIDISPTEDSPFPEQARKNFVSFEAFSSYFDTGILRYEEQTEELIKQLYVPFDTELIKLTSLKISDYLDFFHFVDAAYRASYKRQQEAMEDVRTFIDSINPHAKDPRKEYQRILDFGASDTREAVVSAAQNLNIVTRDEIVDFFGETAANTLLQIFATKRAEREFLYYNGKNPFIKQPLCWLDDNRLFVVHPQFLLNAIYDYLTDILENPKNDFAEKYKRVKAETVEDLFSSSLKSIFGEAAVYHRSVCEEAGTKEHDILIEFSNYLIIAEAKASKVREPFFNPEKAYTRLHDHFHSDSGIGGAYKQAIILKNI